MRITRKQIRNIIKEYYEDMLAKGHIDGHPWSGTPEDLAAVNSKTWGHGALVDPGRFADEVQHAVDLAQGTAGGPLKTKKKVLK